MTHAAFVSSQNSAGAIDVLPDRPTTVDLTWIEGRVEQWFRFGRPVAELRINRSRRTLSFAPDVTFALVRWSSNDFGTVLSRLDIVRTVALGAALQTLPLVRPGGELLLTVSGWRGVERALGVIDAIELAGLDLAEVDPDHWRHVHHRMAAGQEPSAYTAECHRAATLRRRVGA